MITIVSNESSEIIRMFNSAFDDVGALAGDFVPAELLQEIDDINAFVYTAINSWGFLHLCSSRTVLF